MTFSNPFHSTHAAIIWCLGLALGVAGDWPAYRHDARRSAISEEALTFPLNRAWSYQCDQAPSPAWPPPHFIILNRLDFDYAPQPVAAEGMVCFGSSSDDTVRALDLETGQIRWQFTTGGPVRVAPQIAQGRVYFGSDDGCAYCVNAENGKLIWKFNAAPNSEMYLGNGRMISRWPIRTGVLVDQGVAYLVAGMWATEGVFVYALDAEAGDEIWCNDTADYAGVNYNTLLTVENRGELRHGVHDGDFGFYGLTPQGALAVTDDVLLIPNGYNSTAGMDRETGKLLFADPQAGRGGTWVTAESDAFYSMYRHRNMRVLLMKCDPRTGERIGMQQHGIHNLTTTPPSESQAELLHHEPGQTSILVRDGKPVSRNAYAMAMAGEHLIKGGDGYVAVSHAESQEEVWRASVNGKVYGLAIADERLIVTTDLGEVICFGNGSPNSQQAEAKAEQFTEVSVNELLQSLGDAGKAPGYALVVGDQSGALSLSIAQSTPLDVIVSLDDPEAVQRLRKRLLESTDFYGDRIHVPNPTRGLPFADYFANAIVLASDAEIDSDELFRVLRPCGGRLTFVGEGEMSFQRARNALESRVQAGEATVESRGLVRGRLPGAFDWDSKEGPDRRVKWPLRPLWFGGPSTAQVTNYKNENQRPLAAYGRYFVLGEDSLTAIDAYNGAEIWTRPIPGRSPDLKAAGSILHYTEKVWSRELRDEHRRSVRVNDQHVYLQLNEGHFRGEGIGSFVLDARSGNQVQVYAPYQLPESVLLDEANSWTLKIDETHQGSLTLKPGEDSIEITLTTKDPQLTDLDQWELFFDFRPTDSRFGLYEEGVVKLQAEPNDTIRVPVPAKSFGFAAILNSYDGEKGERIQRSYLFCDHNASGLNNGWANVRLTDSEPVAGKPAIIAGEADDLPRLEVVAGWPKAIDGSVAELARLHPLTGEPGPRIFRTGTGTCGGFDFSATSVIKRSGAAKVLGIYDFAEDSGLHTFIGVSAGCGPTTLTSQGLLIVSESKARCVCTFPFRTTLAMAPASRRLNEDWAIFYDRDVDTRIRQAPINLGAPGDRRDQDGVLWLGFPRPVSESEALGYPKLPGTNTEAVAAGVWPVARQACLDVPLEIKCTPNGGPYRFNGDRISVTAPERPWLYASGYQGIRKATLHLDFLKPLATTFLQTGPQIDGIIQDGEWQAQPQARLNQTGADIWFAHSDETLYVAVRRPPPPLTGKSQRRGEVVWTTDTQGEDAEVWKDDSCEIFLTDSDSGRVLHLGGSLSGARFDALDEERTWSGHWKHAAKAGADGMHVEWMIPQSVIQAAGLDFEQLQINVLVNRDPEMGEALAYLGARGREQCANFRPLGVGKTLGVSTRTFQVRLHFAEPEEIAAGERVFSIALEGKQIIEGLDVVAETGGPHRALVREFRNIEAAESLTLEFVPEKGEPILSAIEVLEEDSPDP